MALRRIDLNLLTVFDAVYREGNLTQAAHRIGMSQPAVSNALKRLRHLVDDELFIRDGRGIKPTTRAHDLAPKVNEALLLLEEGLQMPTRFDPAGHDIFNIAGFDYCEIVILPGLRQQLNQRAPHIQLRSITGASSEFPKALRYGEVDVILDYVPLEAKEYKHELLFSEELVILSRHDHPAIGDTLDLATLAEQRFVHRADRADETATEIDEILRKNGLKRDIAISLTNWLALPQIVAGSDLVCSCGKLFAETYATHFKLQIHPFPAQLKPIPIYMIWHERQDEQRAHRWLRAQIKRAVRRF